MLTTKRAQTDTAKKSHDSMEKQRCWLLLHVAYQNRRGKAMVHAAMLKESYFTQ